MNKTLLKLPCVVSAMICALTAGPIEAANPQKSYALQLESLSDPGVSPVQVPVPMTVTVKNESPPSTANSNISSFRFTIQGVTIDQNVALTCGNAQCAFDSTTPNTINVTNISPPIQAQGKVTVTFGATSCGDAAITTASIFSGSQLNGAQFLKVITTDPDFPDTRTAGISCGNLACNQNFVVPNSTTPASIDPNYLSGVRGFYDKDGACAAPEVSDVGYTVTNLIVSDNLLHVEWDSDPAAALAYQVNVVSSTLPVPKVAWLAGGSGPVFITAPYCNVISTNPPTDLPLPKPYGTLAAGISANDKKFTVNLAAGVTLPSVNFDVVVGPQPDFGIERMQVTNVVTGNKLTVTRHTGGTSASDHPISASVMSTPLPILTGYTFTSAQQQAGYANGKQAQMCLATAPVQTSSDHWTFWVIDIGDGFVQPR